MNRNTLKEAAVFALLLAIGVAGRWTQPTWNFTPLAAVTVIGGFYFRQTMPALLLPVGVLAVSDLLLPIHDSWPVMASVYLMMFVPLLLGRSARNAQGLRRGLLLGISGVLPATAFYLVTNFAVWMFKSTYDATLEGLLTCYAAAMPFYRWMLAGDIFYLGVLLACLAIAHAASPMASRDLAEQR
ncbi:MAG: hypothetical protein KDA57_14240 [Planctomycetales bacterium]|nr:hypothetical protein [Planctomycetales bacterium]